jgi:hypothetical protein
MKFIFISVRRYDADFRKFLIESLRAAGHGVWHLRIGRCNRLTSAEGSEELCGIAGLLEIIRRLRVVGAKGKIVYVDSTGAVTPIRSILLRLALRGGTWCFDVFDNLLYDYRGFRLLKARIAIRLLARWSSKLLVLSRESLRFFPSAWHLDNAADVPRVSRGDGNFRDLVVLSAIDQRFDFEFVRELAQLAPARRIVIHGYVLHDNEIIGRRLAELCAQCANVVYRSKYGFDDIPAILGPYAIGLTPYVVGEMTEFVNPDKYYMFLQAGLEVISTAIPQARRMREQIHVVNSPAEVIEVARRIEQDTTFRKNAAEGQDYSWRRRARDLVDIVHATEAAEVRFNTRASAATSLADTANQSARTLRRWMRRGRETELTG